MYICLTALEQKFSLNLIKHDAVKTYQRIPNVGNMSRWMGWTTAESKFHFRHWQGTFLDVVQTDPGVHPDSYPMGTEGSFPGGKAAGA
jgi:hypothetical protein